jgi:hypothetical protein
MLYGTQCDDADRAPVGPSRRCRGRRFGRCALTAATLAHDGGAEVLVIEKADMLGGTTAVSGGAAWLPGNHKMAEAGIEDSREDALACARRVTAGSAPDPSLFEVFVDTAPEMIRYLEEHTPLRVHISPLPDCYWPFGVPGSRAVPAGALEADPYPVREELPGWADRFVKRGTLMSLGTATTLTGDLMPQSPELQEELRRREERDVRPKGAALVARLFKGLLERGVEALLETPARDVVTNDAGEVIGVVDRNGQVRRLGGGVVGGLYAAGNTAANVFGWAYPSGGGTIANGMVFGYLAGKHAAAQPAREV